jgi:hypothetical protein
MITLLVIILIICVLNLLFLIPISIVLVRIMEVLSDMASTSMMIPPAAPRGRRFGPDTGAAAKRGLTS